MEMIFMKNEDIKILREKLYLKNNKICPVIKLEIDISECVLDHKHKKNIQSVLGQEDYGCIRNTIDKRANSFEGKVLKDYIRSGLSKDIKLPDLLRNLADYIEEGAYIEDNIRYIHPKEQPKSPIIRKRDFNKLNKAYLIKYPNRKPLDYPKSKKLSNRFIELFNDFDITINY